MSEYMQVRVSEASPNGVLLQVPLKPNINHKRTAFGGSVHSLAVLSCWALVTVTVEDLKAEGLSSDYIVVQDSQIDYRLPIDTDFSARASWPSVEARNHFLRTLRRFGRARATLSAEVFTESGTCAILEARFAAQVERKDSGVVS